jgi:signal transduction histidine kinase
MLAGLPARLIPGAIPHEPAPFFSPIRVALVVAWPCMLLGAGALLGLLLGTLRLSERRGAFVSSVTHELRTPLTTFRMYAEMLAEGMVTSEAQRTDYLRTLCTQADRLSHLVENVLTYARIERKRLQFTQETLQAEELLRRTRDRLEERTRHANMQLVVELTPESAATTVRTCPSAVEQILFNLVDNACKYASSAKDTRIHLRIEPSGGTVRLLVADHGPGVAPDQLRTLFTPFSKSARDAANSAPGVGLGLALSKRLARAIGADLVHVASPDYGACFALRLRR